MSKSSDLVIGMLADDWAAEREARIAAEIERRAYRDLARAALARVAEMTRRERRLMARVRELLDALRAEREARAEVERELRWLRAQLVRDKEAA